MKNLNDTLTVVQVSERMNVTKQTVWNWIKSGKLRAEKKKTGLSYRYTISEAALKEFADILNLNS